MRAALADHRLGYSLHRDGQSDHGERLIFHDNGQGHARVRLILRRVRPFEQGRGRLLDGVQPPPLLELAQLGSLV